MSDDSALDTCGCCARQPCACATTTNRPGLPAIRYRLGTHATFLCSLIDQLPSFTVEDEDGTEFRPLAKLTTRADNDPTIALLDAFAVVCDVLTFYQERIANEGYLRTATERRSVLELAREVGYELNPGVAAATYLAFVVEDAPSAPKRATVPVGIKVQSVPGPDERPQVFETMDETLVRAEWNALVPRQTHVQRLVIKGNKLYVDNTEVRELYLAGTGLNLKAADALLVVQGGNTLPLAITSISEDGANERTRVDLGARVALPVETQPVLPAAVVEQAPIAQTLANVKHYILGQQWEEEDLQAFLAVQKWDAGTMLTQVQTLLAADVADAKVYTFKQRVGFFGASAPLYRSLPIPVGAHRPTGYPKDWDQPPISIWRDGTTSTDSDLILMVATPAVIG